MAFSNPNTNPIPSHPPHVSLGSTAAHPLLTVVQTLKQQLDTALERIQEYEHALLHQDTLSRQFFYSLRTQDGLVCPNCNQAVAHTCSSAILQPPLSRYYEYQPSSSSLGNPRIQRNLFGEHVAAQSSSASSNSSASHVQPLPPSRSNISSSLFTSHSTNPYPTPVALGNPAALQPHFTGPTAQGDFFGEHVVAQSAHTAFESFASHLQPMRPSSSDIPSVFTCPPTDPNPYPITSFPFSTVPSLSRPTSSYPTLHPPRPSIAINSQYNCSNNNSLLRKRDLHRADLECKPERKRVRQNLAEERFGRNEDRQSELDLFRFPDTPSLRLPSCNDTTYTVSEAMMSSSVPEVRPTTSDSDDISQQESEADWDIRYKIQVKSALDVSLVRSLDLGPGKANRLQFSKDGKYLAVGFSDYAMTNIYDVETGEKTCTLRVIDGEDAIFALCFSPDSLYLATGEHSSVCIWEISRKYVRNVLRHLSNVTCIDFSPDGHLIASGAIGSVDLIIWNWRDGTRKTLEGVEVVIIDIRFSPNGQYIAAGIGNALGGVLIWNVRSGKLVEKLMGDVNVWVRSIAFTPDGVGLVSTASESKGARLWDISLFGMGGSVSQLQNGGMEVDSSKERLKFGADEYDFVAVSSNSRWVVTYSMDHNIQAWNAHNAELHCEVSLRRPNIYPDVSTFAFSPVRGFVAHSLGLDRVLLWKFKEVMD